MIVEDGEHYKGILLYSLHPEGYDDMFYTPKWRSGFARSHTIADFYHMNEVGLEIPSSWEEKLQGIGSFMDTTFGNLFFVSGTVQDHVALCNEFFQSLKDGPHGGDDDTYDYWPAATEMFEDYCRDIANWNKSILALCRELGRNNQNVDEWEEQAKILINLH